VVTSCGKDGPGRELPVLAYADRVHRGSGVGRRVTKKPRRCDLRGSFSAIGIPCDDTYGRKPLRRSSTLISLASSMLPENSRSEKALDARNAGEEGNPPEIRPALSSALVPNGLCAWPPLFPSRTKTAEGYPAAALGFDSVLGCVRIRWRSRFNEPHH
jgi:hypothetical protein